MRKYTALAFVGLLLLLGTAACSQSASGILAITNGTVFPATNGEPIQNGVVLVENGVITAVGSAAEIEVPRGARVIDAAGGTIMPGLVDAHTHVLELLNFTGGDLSATRVNANLERPLAAGVTTMRDLGSSVQTAEEIADLRRALEGLGNSIPTIVLTGPIIAHAESPMLGNFGSQMIPVSTADEAAAAAQGLVDAGVDQIKIMLHTRPNAGPPVGETPEESAPSLSLEQVQAIVGVAHDHGVWVTAHVVDPRDADLALAADVDQFAHWPSATQPLPQDILQALADRGMPVVTTFAIMPAFEDDARVFLDAGGIIVFGTDAPGVGSLSRPTRELLGMANAGMEPVEILLAATRDAAAAVGLGDRLGTLEAGKQADIIVLAGDPLEDIGVVEDIRFVIKNGEVVVQPAQ